MTQNIVLISCLAGLGAGGLVWFGWELVHNLMARRHPPEPKEGA